MQKATPLFLVNQNRQSPSKTYTNPLEHKANRNKQGSSEWTAETVCWTTLLETSGQLLETFKPTLLAGESITVYN